jgi:hypothetical protein
MVSKSQSSPSTPAPVWKQLCADKFLITCAATALTACACKRQDRRTHNPVCRLTFFHDRQKVSTVNTKPPKYAGVGILLAALLIGGRKKTPTYASATECPNWGWTSKPFLKKIEFQRLIFQIARKWPVVVLWTSSHSFKKNWMARRVGRKVAKHRVFPMIYGSGGHSFSCIRYLSETHFVRDFLQKLKTEDVKTKLSCATSLEKWKCKMWKRSFRARRPSKSESGGGEISWLWDLYIYRYIFFSGIVKWNIKYYVLLFIYMYIDCIVFFPNSIS